MLYKITSSSWYRDERLLEEYPCLKDFGWKLVEHDRICYRGIPEIFYNSYIEINSLEELQKLQAAVQNPLIFTEDEIEIYDGYRE